MKKNLSTSKLRAAYSSFGEFKEYCEIYNNHTRLGFKNPAEAWKKNPTIQYSTNPADYKTVNKD